MYIKRYNFCILYRKRERESWHECSKPKYRNHEMRIMKNPIKLETTIKQQFSSKKAVH